MADVNNITITGRLGQDAEMRYTPDGVAVLSFSVGNGTYKKGHGDYNSLTTWYRVSLFGTRAESLYQIGALVKGARVGVTGVHSMRPWTDKDGNERLACEIAANDVTLLDSKGDNGNAPADEAPRQSKPAPAKTPTRNVPRAIESDEDLPF